MIGDQNPATPDDGPWHRADRFLARLRPHREPLSLLVDALVVVACWNVTYLFRLGFERWTSARPSYDGWVLLGVVAAYVATFTAFRVPQSMWRFSGFGEIKRLTLACAFAGISAAAVVMGLQLTKVPRAVLALHPVVTLMGVCVVRVAYRMLFEHLRSRVSGSLNQSRRALVMGAGEAARMLLAGIHRQGWTVTGLLDDDPAKRRARIAGVPVVGRLEDVLERDVRAAATHIVVALPAATVAQRRRALDLAGRTGLPVLTVPSVDELREGKSRIERLRDIEPEDLLGREPVQLDEAGIGRTLRGKTVLVTGAGGSIGAELCRQIARFQPTRLVLFEQSEFNLYSVEQALSESHPELPLVRLIGDVKDEASLARCFDAWKPEVVFHAAAYKHVPLVEDHNASIALHNNTLGTWRTAKAAAAHGVERFVLISTDKAVNPSNVMGATKRAAEIVITAMAAEHPSTRFIAVRFGNVLGSSGSVIPKFKEQIARGGPVTVTHPEMIRYFMTIPEAVLLVLQAAAIGESGQVLVLEMGEPVKIVDLARDMVRLSGHTEAEIPIVFTGLRPGEKLYEELLADSDTTLPTPIERLRIARLGESANAVDLAAWLRACEEAEGEGDAEVRARLRQLVPEFRSNSVTHTRASDALGTPPG